MLDDTWTFDGAVWRRQRPSKQPIAQDVAKVAYDESSQTTVFLGAADNRALDYAHRFGANPVGADAYATWIWDGAQWTRVYPAHQPHGYVIGMAYDQRSFAVVAVTHAQSRGFTQGCSDQTWTWNGDDWAERSLINAPTRALVTDPTTGRALALVDPLGPTGLGPQTTCTVGSAGTRPAEMWRWDDTQWVRVGLAPIIGSNGWVAADAQRKQLLAYQSPSSGPSPNVGLLGEQLRWNGSVWSDAGSPAMECVLELSDASLVDDLKVGGPILLTNTMAAYRNVVEVQFWDGTHWRLLPTSRLCN